MYTFSLGATNFGPPSTDRGTIVNAAAALATERRNCLRVTFELCMLMCALSSNGSTIAGESDVPARPRDVVTTLLMIPRHPDVRQNIYAQSGGFIHLSFPEHLSGSPLVMP
jgi:hypothetical protein